MTQVTIVSQVRKRDRVVIVISCALLGVISFWLACQFDELKTISTGGVVETLSEFGVLVVPILTGIGTAITFAMINLHLFIDKRVSLSISFVSGLIAVVFLWFFTWLAVTQLFALSEVYKLFLE